MWQKSKLPPVKLLGKGGLGGGAFGGVCACVSVCVCERERERGGEGEGTYVHLVLV